MSEPNRMTRDEIRAKYGNDQNWPIQSFDAQDWAKAFKDKWGDASPDEATMLAWFAAALMRGYDEHRWAQEVARPADAGLRDLYALHRGSLGDPRTIPHFDDLAAVVTQLTAAQRRLVEMRWALRNMRTAAICFEAVAPEDDAIQDIREELVEAFVQSSALAARPAAPAQSDFNAGLEAAAQQRLGEVQEALRARPITTMETKMTEDQIKHMVDRFLAWSLPINFKPDCGISFRRTHSEDTMHLGEYHPVGTNLFSADQAKAMVLHMLDGLPLTPSPATEMREAESQPSPRKDRSR